MDPSLGTPRTCGAANRTYGAKAKSPRLRLGAFDIQFAIYSMATKSVHTSPVRRSVYIQSPINQLLTQLRTQRGCICGSTDCGSG
jgi:hypothetical protein